MVNYPESLRCLNTDLAPQYNITFSNKFIGNHTLCGKTCCAIERNLCHALSSKSLASDWKCGDRKNPVLATISERPHVVVGPAPPDHEVIPAEATGAVGCERRHRNSASEIVRRTEILRSVEHLIRG